MADDFKSQLAADLATVILNEHEFAELVTYTPVGKSARRRTAIVERVPIEPVTAGPAGATYPRTRYRLTMSPDPATGIETVTVGKDRVDCLAHLTDANATKFVVSAILDQDPGAWHLEITK